MPMSFDVTLPRSHKAVFPDKCIVCNGKPDSSVALTHNGTSLFWVLVLPVVMLFGMRTLRAPICRSCKPKFIWRRAQRLLLVVVIAVPLLFLLKPHIEDFPRILQRVIYAVIAVVILVPFILAEVLNPPPFDITASGDSLDYEFKSEEYAHEFRELNADVASATS